MKKLIELLEVIGWTTLRFVAYAPVFFFLGGLAGPPLSLLAYGLGGLCYGVVLRRALDVLAESARRAGIEEGKALAYDAVIEIMRVHGEQEAPCEN